MNWQKGLGRIQRVGTVLALVGGGCLVLLVSLNTLLNYTQYEYVSRWAGSLLIGLPLCVLGVMLLILSWVVEGFVSGDRHTRGPNFPK